MGVHRMCALSARAKGAPVTYATASTTRQKLPAVRRSLAGLPVHRAPGGLLVVPVLQPAADSIPFGLALSLQGEAVDTLQASSLQNGPNDLYELQYVLDGEGELRVRSGVLQSINAGDCILAPIGRAWCQLASDATISNELAVLKLLVPGHLPHGADQQQQGLVDGASRVLDDWQASPVVGSLAANTVTGLLVGAKKQAALAVDSWNVSHDTTDIASSTGADVSLPSTATEPVLARAISNEQASVSGRDAITVSSTPLTSLPKQGHQMLQGLITASQRIMNSVNRSPLAKLLWPDQCVVKKTLSELSAFQLPNQTNRLALIFDPLDHEVPFTFGVEIFEQGHKTNPHTHAVSHELFFILAGDGIGFCDDERFPVTAGDVVVFPPTSLHGIDNGPDSKMYCLELMLPNDMFAEFVRQGQPAGRLRDDDMCIMIAQGCSSA